jgi:hypothetical protein
VIDGYDRDLVRINSIEDAIREPPDHHSSNARGNFGSSLWNAADAFERLFHAEDKILSQPLPLSVIPGLGIG